MYLQPPGDRGTARQGLSVTCGNIDSDAGPIISPACTGHRDYIGGWKPPPPTVPPAQHAYALTSSEQAESIHFPVHQGGGEEAPTDGGIVDVGERGEGIPGLRKTA